MHIHVLKRYIYTWTAVYTSYQNFGKGNNTLAHLLTSHTKYIYRVPRTRS